MAPPSNPRRDAIVQMLVVVVLPTIILVFFSGEEALGHVGGLITALLFPIGHGLWGFFQTRSLSPLSVLVFVSILVTGGIGLLELDPAWFALKEAVVALGMGLAVVGSAWTRWSVIGVLLDTLLEPDHVHAALEKTGRQADWEAVVRTGTLLLGGVMLLSAGGTYLLAKTLVTSTTGTEAFNTELGHYTLISYPILMIPMMGLMLLVLRKVLDGLEAATNTDVEDLMRPEHRAEQPPQEDP